jgi:hypothetical protein
MTWEDKIKAGVISIVKTYLASSKLRAPKMCTVVNVSGDAVDGCMICDCKPIDGSAVIEDVKLIADYPGSQAGFILVPSENSLVQVSFNSDSDAYVSMVSLVDKIFLNGNDYGGLVEVQPLVTKLNNLENKLNDLISKYNLHQHTGVTTGTGTSAITTQPEVGVLTPTQQSELENTAVEHGLGNLS